MAEIKQFVDLNLQTNSVINLKTDTLDITTNLASANAKRIAYHNGQYYYSNGISWILLGGSANLPTGGTTGQILAKNSNTDYDVTWIENYTSTVKHEVKAGEALSAANAVYVSSANGTNMIVSKASNAAESTSSKTMGLVATSAALNDQIFVITEGLLTGTGGNHVDTSSATAGDPVWLGTNGNLIFGLTNKPVAPAHLVFIGIVTRVSSTVGEIFVKVQNGFELNEIHDVLISSPATGQLLRRDSDNLWKNWTPNFITGSGTANRITKWTGTSAVGNGTLYDNGTQISNSGTYVTDTTISISSGLDNLYGLNIFSTGGGIIASSLSFASTGIAGYSNDGVGVYGASTGPGDGFVNNNIGVKGYAAYTDLPAFGTQIGGRFEATGGANNYAVQLIDGTQGVGKFLKSVTSDGKANWGTLTVADTGLTLTTTGTSGAATLVGNTLNIPQYTGGSSGTVTSVGLTTDTTGTDISVSNSPITSSGSITLSIPTASATNRGALSSTDWSTFNSKQAAITVTNTGTSGAATLTAGTLNIPTYRSSEIPSLTGVEIWRGSTFRNNSTTIDTTAGIVLSTSGTNTARSVGTTSYATRGIRLGVTASIVATGRYSGMRGGSLFWYVTGGFLYTGEFNISDTATATGTHNFWGLASSTSDLSIGDIANNQPSALTNIIAFANDSGDSNIQFMYNDGTGTATKVDMGASFPSNRTVGAAITAIYSCYIYNAPNSSSVIYRIVNKETGVAVEGTISSNLPASTTGLNFFGVRTMGTSGGGVTNSGQFDVYRLGVYSL